MGDKSHELRGRYTVTPQQLRHNEEDLMIFFTKGMEISSIRTRGWQVSEVGKIRLNLGLMLFKCKEIPWNPLQCELDHWLVAFTVVTVYSPLQYAWEIWKQLKTYDSRCNLEKLSSSVVGGWVCMFTRITHQWCSQSTTNGTSAIDSHHFDVILPNCGYLLPYWTWPRATWRRYGR